jgi:metal-responsive CopG/Arc/MetJ family transcriptional regulator
MVKKVFSVTIEESILEKWREFVEDNCVNSSKLVEKILKEHLERKSKREKRDKKEESNKGK